MQKLTSSRAQSDLSDTSDSTQIATTKAAQAEGLWGPLPPGAQEPRPFATSGEENLLDNTVSRESPEPVQTDLDGQYIGPASGISFLLRARRRLQQQPTTGTTSIFTFDDAPLPKLGPHFRVTLSKLEMTKLVQRYFDFVSAVDRFLYRPAVQGWLEAFHENDGHLGNEADDHARLALLYMIFAKAQDHTSPKPSTAASDIR